LRHPTAQRRLGLVLGPGFCARPRLRDRERAPAGNRLDSQALLRLNESDRRAVEEVLATRYPEESRPAASYFRELVRNEIVVWPPPPRRRVIWDADVLSVLDR
jgi:hypothetical protein